MSAEWVRGKCPGLGRRSLSSPSAVGTLKDSHVTDLGILICERNQGLFKESDLYAVKYRPNVSKMSLLIVADAYSIFVCKKRTQR